ncbi:MAG: Fic family protein [Bacteroidetes bacterium]|nr:Fic family protein [Bacteroidota bacterium]
MPSPSEKLTDSLEVLKKALANTGALVIRSNMITRTHRERLVSNGFLVEILKGWYILTRPDEKNGDSTLWYTSFWQFCSSYLDYKLSGEWVVSPEQSLLIHAENWTIPDQLFIKSPNGNNNLIKLPHETSVFDLKSTIPEKERIIIRNNVHIYPFPLALISCSEKFFRQYPMDARAVLQTLKDTSDILSPLLDGGHTVIAGRIAGAYRNINRSDVADEIVNTMKSAGFDVREKDPFEEPAPQLLFQRNLSPYVYRVQQMWQQMREVVLEDFQEPPKEKVNILNYLKDIDEIYKHDAYNSLSIEGYQITQDLIERVKLGAWNPDSNSKDEKDKDAMAARGYWLAFNSVKESISKVLSDADAGEIAEVDHRVWYRELFSPSVATGILKPSELAGYRNTQVFIRNSKHVPLSPEAVRDVMPAFFDLLKNEPEPFVKSVLGHFVFVYIHPYNDGNGRIARFLMNLMLSSGAFPWTVIPLEERDSYMDALEEASVNNNIRPFAKFIHQLVFK